MVASIDYSKKEALAGLKPSHLSLGELFQQNNFKDFFLKAHFLKEDGINSREELRQFYNVLTNEKINTIRDSKVLVPFLEDLNSFLDSPYFSDEEKRAFFNKNETRCIHVSIYSKRFDIATNVNKFRKVKDLSNSTGFVQLLASEAEYNSIEQLISLSTNVGFNHSEILRILFYKDVRNLDLFDKLIETYNLDINGVGNTLDKDFHYSFAQAVFFSFGTKSNILFDSFIEKYKESINFDVSTASAKKGGVRVNLIGIIFDVAQIDISLKLDRLNVILKTFELSEKHIGAITQNIISEKSKTSVQYYDHPIFETLFSHPSFNSNLFDREAVLNTIVLMDNQTHCVNARKQSNGTVNPTSVLLDKFFKYAHPVVNSKSHPFVTWVKNQRPGLCEDTLRSLLLHYSSEIDSLELYKFSNHYPVRLALHNAGVKAPKRPSIFAFLFPKKSVEKAIGNEIIMDNTSVVTTENPKEPIAASFNTKMIEQVKNDEIRKLIDCVIMNHEQYEALAKNGPMHENEHYMKNLLPKFLNHSVDTYLHFLTLDEKEATEQAMIQLKLLNKKTFEALRDELNRGENELKFQSNVHSKVIQSYKG